MNPTELRVKLTSLMGWLALHFETYFYWFTLAVLIGLFTFGLIGVADLVLWFLTWTFLTLVSKRVKAFAIQLSDLNDKFAVNQRKLTKSIKDHNDFVTETLSSQKRFFDSFVNPKRGDN